MKLCLPSIVKSGEKISFTNISDSFIEIEYPDKSIFKFIIGKWINTKDELPEHNQIVLCYSTFSKGYGVSVFVDSVKMNETLYKTGYGREAVDVDKNPYYFVSQEVKQHTYKKVTHWMTFPDRPDE